MSIEPYGRADHLRLAKVHAKAAEEQHQAQRSGGGGGWIDRHIALANMHANVARAIDELTR